MNDLALDAVDTRSTSLEADAQLGPSGAGTPKLEPEAKPTLRDAITESVKETDAAKPDAKPDETKDEKAPEKGAEKPEEGKEPSDAKDGQKGAQLGPDGKFAAKETATEPDANGKAAEQPKDAEAKPENGDKRHIEPPAKFLPDAKETWRNTPRAVQRDVENMAREHEAEITRHREAAERYEPIRQYDEMARQNGRAGVHESLAEVARLEDMMQRNPLAALNQILLQAGPRKADGQPVSLFEFAQAVVQMGPQGYQKAVTSAPQQQAPQNDNPEVKALRDEIAQMKVQQLAATVIEPFKASHPRYDELQGDIALFLKSDKIPTSLSPQERLEAAYDMAVRINPASHSAAEPKADPDPGRRAVDDDLSGSKSIKSAPGAVSPDMEPERGGSTRDILRAEMKRQAVR